MRPVKIEFLRSLYTSMDEYEALDQWKSLIDLGDIAARAIFVVPRG